MTRKAMLTLLAASVFAAALFAEDNLTSYSMVTRDGRRLVSRVDGGKTVYELVATNALPAGLPSVREWTIYGI